MKHNSEMKKKFKIYYNTGNYNDYRDMYEAVYQAIVNAAKLIEGQIELISSFQIEVIYEATRETRINLIRESDLVITNISSYEYGITYNMGLLEGLGKPSILIANQMARLSAITSGTIYLYDKGIEIEFVNRLTKMIVKALKTPEKYKKEYNSINSSENTKKIFVSYSHRDTEYLDRLKIHIKPLERNNEVLLWSDTLNLGGEKWQSRIEKELNEASIAILLISADFIASDFIVKNELPPLLKNAKNKGTVILPVILKPCRFLREPNLSQFQAINDPARPLCKLAEHEQEEIYELIAQRVEIALQTIK